LKELFLRNPDKLDAMVNYEALIIEANQQLTRENKEPLCAIYPTDAITIADSPLGYLNKGDATKEEAFLKLQAHLLTPDVQNTIKSMGRRTGLVGLDASDVDSNVFNPDWCIDVNRVISPVPIPDEPVIQQALSMYQGVLRKPSFTVFALDFSGSMEGEGVRDLKQSISSLLDPQQASRFLLQPSQDDITVLLPFNHAPATPIIVKGNDPAELEAAKNTINNLSPKGGTNIYRAAEAGLSIMKSMGVENYLPSIILLTDGRSDGNDAVLKAKLMKSYLGKDVPIFSITFGKAVKDQLEELANASSGRVFNGHKGLMKAFRAAKGYN
jgi:Ca-activated chloride channel family protein